MTADDKENGQKGREPIKCPLCGFTFERGVKTACTHCPLNYESCHFEKCPHCGYDIAQGSFLWTAAETAWKKMKNFVKGEKNDGIPRGTE